MGTVQHLTVDGVKRAARRYFRAGKLTAQHPVKARRRCLYQVGQYRCAVGAAMTKSTLLKCPFGGVELLLGGGGIVTVDDLQALNTIQIAHDDWATLSCQRGARHDDTLRAKAHFLRLIGAA